RTQLSLLTFMRFGKLWSTWACLQGEKSDERTQLAIDRCCTYRHFCGPTRSVGACLYCWAGAPICTSCAERDPEPPWHHVAVISEPFGCYRGRDRSRVSSRRCGGWRTRAGHRLLPAF